MSAAVQTVLCQKMVSGSQDSQQRGRDRRHSTRSHQRGFGVLERRKLLMQCQVVWTVVQTNVADVVIALLARVFEHRSLENREAHCAQNSRLGLPGMDKLGFDPLEGFH